MSATVLNNQSNLKIDSIYAFVAIGEEGEGIMAGSTVIDGIPMMLPLVGADIERVISLYPMAKQISKASGRDFKVYKFDNKSDVTEMFASNRN